MPRTTEPFALPSLDLSDVAGAVAMREAGRGTGMLAVVGHAVSPAVLATQFALAHEFFALPVAEKRAIAVQPGTSFRGYIPFQSQTIDEAAPGDLKEGFIMGPDLPPTHPHVRAAYPNTGANRWPERPARLHACMEAYVAVMNDLGRRLAGVFAQSLDLPVDFFADALADPLTYSQLLHYPSLPGVTYGRSLGAGAHVDWGFFTLLVQDDVGGLEVLDPNGAWCAVPPDPSVVIVIFGEMVVRLTDGRYRSAKHRVARNVSGRSRYSMPTFFDPPYDYRVACVPTCCPAEGAPRFPARTVAEHMREMARQPLSTPAR